MSWREISAELKEVRPRRHLFVRKVQIGSSAAEDDGNESNSSTKIQSSTETPRTIQLVCVHGTCGTEQQYHPLLHQIHADLKASGADVVLDCLLYDWLGCGQSALVAPETDFQSRTTNEECYADLEALLLLDLNPRYPVWIMGHSYAFNMFAPILFSKLDFCWDGIILLCSGIRDERKSLPYTDGGPWILTKLPVFLLECLQPLLTRDFVSRGIHPKHASLRQAVLNASNSNNMSVVKAYYSNHRWLTQQNLESFVSIQRQQVKANDSGIFFDNLPVLVVHGADDQIISLQTGQALVRALQKLQQHDGLARSRRGIVELVVVDEARHLVMMEDPAAVSKAVVTFLMSQRNSKESS
jgi:pimeloyl-ACP methyl ester carboxylesterase